MQKMPNWWPSMEYFSGPPGVCMQWKVGTSAFWWIPCTHKSAIKICKHELDSLNTLHNTGRVIGGYYYTSHNAAL